MTICFSQTFRARLTEVVDQAQHFASIGGSSGGGNSVDQGMAFREGLDGTERERECTPPTKSPLHLLRVRQSPRMLNELRYSFCVGAVEREDDEKVA